MKKLLKLSIILGLLSLFTMYSAYSYSTTVSNNISNSVFRLHVIANSDSAEDQNLKYKVRDNIINYMNEISLNTNSKENEFYNIAKETIKNNGYNYDVSINIGNYYFPTKTYGDIDFPAGFYDALRIEIGNANRSKLVVCSIPSFMLC